MLGHAVLYKPFLYTVGGPPCDVGAGVAIGGLRGVCCGVCCVGVSVGRAGGDVGVGTTRCGGRGALAWGVGGGGGGGAGVGRGCCMVGIS